MSGTDIRSSSSSLRVGLRCESGPTEGLGHVARSSVLADSLARIGVECCFLVGDDDGMAERFLESRGFPVAVLTPGPPRPDEVGRLPAELDGVVLDVLSDRVLAQGTSFMDDYVAAARRRYAKLVFLDGLFETAYRSDGASWLEVNLQPYVGAEQDHPPRAHRWLRGAAYALVDPGYAAIGYARTHDHSRNVLVTFGGSDPQGVTAEVLATLAAGDANTALRVIIGPGFRRDHRDRIRGIAARSPERIGVVENTRDLRPHYAWAHAAVCGSGGMRYELAAAGVPTVFAAIARDHEPNSEVFAAGGFACYLGYHADIAPAQWREAVQTILTDAALRHRMSTKAMETIDGAGAQRSAYTIREVLGE